jgi:hypothetical protein
VSVNITRGKIRYATGTAITHAGIARFRLDAVRPMKRGRYLVTIVATQGKRSTVVRYRQTIA